MEKCQNSTFLKGLFGNNYRVAEFSALYLTVLGIIISSLKSIGQFDIPKLKKQKIVMLEMDILTFRY